MSAVKRNIVVLCMLALLCTTVALTQNENVRWYLFSGGFAIPSAPNTAITSVVGQATVGSTWQADSFIESGFLSHPSLRGVVVGVGDDGERPALCALSQNFPNPFNPATVISYQLPATSDVKLVVFDVLGREVATLVNGVEEPGYKSVQWDASGVASGVYFYRLQAGGFVSAKKLVLLK